VAQEHLTANCRLLHILNAHINHHLINEDRVFSSISQLTEEVEKIEAFCGYSLHTISMHNEIERLEDKLAYSKNQISLCTKKFEKINLEG
jgi:hypothetical protein